MAFVAIDRDIAGQGVEDLGSPAALIYFIVTVTTAGVFTKIPEMNDPDHVIRVGFISLGDDVDGSGDPLNAYWREPIWIEWMRHLWTPDPDNVAGTVMTTRCRFIRWSFLPGSEGHIYGYAA